MTNNSSKLIKLIEKNDQIQLEIETALNQEQVDLFMDLVDNRGRLLNVIEQIAKKELKTNPELGEEISKLYKKVQHFNECMNPKLALIKESLCQQIAQTYKNKVSLRGYKSTNVKP